MSNYLPRYPFDYAALKQRLGQRKSMHLRCGRNLLLVQEEGYFSIRSWDTEIVAVYPDETFVAGYGCSTRTDNHLYALGVVYQPQFTKEWRWYGPQYPERFTLRNKQVVVNPEVLEQLDYIRNLFIVKVCELEPKAYSARLDQFPGLPLRGYVYSEGPKQEEPVCSVCRCQRQIPSYTILERNPDFTAAWQKLTALFDKLPNAVLDVSINKDILAEAKRCLDK